MGSVFARWFVSLLLFNSCSFGDTQVCPESDYWWEGDTSLVLPSDEPERLVSMTGELQLHVLNKDPEDNESDIFDCWILKMNPASFEIACSTPVRASFQSPESIRSCVNSNELELTGGYDEVWLREHLGQTVTVSGYLWHAHTIHHHTAVMMDTDPWFK